MTHTLLRRTGLFLCGIALIVVAILHADQQEAVSIFAYFAGLTALAFAVKPLSPMHIV